MESPNMDVCEQHLPKGYHSIHVQRGGEPSVIPTARGHPRPNTSWQVKAKEQMETGSQFAAYA